MVVTGVKPIPPLALFDIKHRRVAWPRRTDLRHEVQPFAVVLFDSPMNDAFKLGELDLLGATSVAVVYLTILDYLVPPLVLLRYDQTPGHGRIHFCNVGGSRTRRSEVPG